MDLEEEKLKGKEQRIRQRRRIYEWDQKINGRSFNEHGKCWRWGKRERQGNPRNRHLPVRDTKKTWKIWHVWSPTKKEREKNMRSYYQHVSVSFITKSVFLYWSCKRFSVYSKMFQATECLWLLSIAVNLPREQKLNII